MALNKAQIASYVTNKFITSSYIKNRTNPSGAVKYYDEEIQFWTNQIFNCNWDLTVFDSEFELTYSLDHSKSQSKLQYNDYIGQTFYIDKDTYKQGMYISSIDIFCAKQTIGSSMTLDVRPLINGIPGEPIPMSSVPFTTALESEYKWDATVDAANQYSKVNFAFEFPIFLSPGYYCFTLKTNSSMYSVFIAENGKGNIDSGTIVTNPYLGDYIYSGQGESWVIDPTKDLCFIINKAKFNLGDKTLYLTCSETNSLGFDYDILRLTTNTKEVSNVAYINSSTVSVTDFYTDNQTEIPIKINSNITTPSHSKISSQLQFTLTLTNTDENLTPIIDLDGTGIALTKNYIDPYSIEISNSELSGINGLAHAKYVSKPVTLNDEFDADGITVYVDVNKPDGTNIELFYRVLNRYDYSIPFEESPWYRLPKKSGATPALLSSNYAEELYENLAISYNANGTEYNSFNQLAVKVVFYSDEPSRVPTIKNLRVIATV